jgi:hypothetical protein
MTDFVPTPETDAIWAQIQAAEAAYSAELEAVEETRLALISAAAPHRQALSNARELLLAYGTPEGLSFTETYSAVQTAALEYRDSGIEDKECEDHLQWIIARTGQITAAALFQAGILE